MLHQTFPVERNLPETEAESGLRALYPHPEGALRLGMIATAGGEATGVDGTSRSLNGTDDVRVLRVLRAAADVILVGATTARHENYGPIAVRDSLAATRVPEQRRAPVLAVASFTGDLPSGLGPDTCLLVTTAEAPAIELARDWGDSLVVAGRDAILPRLLVAVLAERGFTRVLCEGGPALARLLLEHGVVSDYCLTESPLPGDPSGPLVPPVPEGFTLSHTLEGEGFTMRRWGNPRG